MHSVVYVFQTVQKKEYNYSQYRGHQLSPIQQLLVWFCRLKIVIVALELSDIIRVSVCYSKHKCMCVTVNIRVCVIVKQVSVSYSKTSVCVLL